jgi:hypothetical protein
MGVNNRALVRRLRAWSVGGPVAKGTTVQVGISDQKNRFLLAFIRMGGESRPWGVAWKSGTGAIKVRTCAEPRMRDFVDEMLLELSEDLAAHLGHPYYDTVVQPGKDHRVGQGDLPQVWVPNSSHIDMLHFLSYAYIRRKGDTEADVSLRMLGRTSLHLFLESRRPGQQLIIESSAALRSAYDFPCEDARQGHIGLLLSWLENRTNRDRGLAAAMEAEQLPIGTSLDPEMERKPLSALVEKYNNSREGYGRGDKKIEKNIHEVLKPELVRRLDLVAQAIAVLENDERDYNGGLDELVHATASQLYWDYLRPEERAIDEGKEPFAVSPETDWNARNAAGRFYRHSAAQDRERNALIHFDRELEAEAINAGSAFRGVVTSVSDEGTTRSTVPVWTILDHTPGALSFRVWDKVCIVGAPKRQAVIRDIEPHADGSLAITIEITNLKKSVSDAEWPHRMAGADPSWLGLAVTIIGTSFADMTEKKALKARSFESSPADWLIDRISQRPVTAGDDE